MSELIGGWVAGLTATLIREGINKHRAREIAQGYWEAYCKDDEEVERLEKDNAEWQDGYSALTAEVERLREALTANTDACHDEVHRLQTEVERLRAEVNEFRRVLRSVVRYDVGYEWDDTKMCHTPLLKIEFSDVPAGEPNTAVGWLDRDAFSASIDAARGES